VGAPPPEPITAAVDVLADRWSLLILRDVIFADRRYFRALLTGSAEGIASNILADRLKRLVAAGLLTRRPDPQHRQKGIYSLTEPAIQLLPLLAQMAAWGRRHMPASHELSVRAELLEQGGPALWEAFMEELRHLHLGAPRPQHSVFGELQAAYENAMR